jgi:hypothetical protein
MPDYKTNTEIIGRDKNILLAKTEVSDIKDEDFAITALELKVKKLEQELITAHQTNQSAERESI